MARKRIKPRVREEMRKRKRFLSPSGEYETYKQRRKRLQKAGYTELEPPTGTKRKTKYKLRERARREAVRLIAKSEGLTIKEARKKYKRGLIEYIWENPKRKAVRKFFEVSPGKFLEYEKGKPAKLEYTFGTVKDSAYVQRTIGLQKYWNTVKLIAHTWDISIEDARKYVTKTRKQFGKRQAEEAILVDLGVYEQTRGKPGS